MVKCRRALLLVQDNARHRTVSIELALCIGDFAIRCRYAPPQVYNVSFGKDLTDISTNSTNDVDLVFECCVTRTLFQQTMDRTAHA